MLIVWTCETIAISLKYTIALKPFWLWQFSIWSPPLGLLLKPGTGRNSGTFHPIPATSASSVSFWHLLFVTMQPGRYSLGKAKVSHNTMHVTKSLWKAVKKCDAEQLYWPYMLFLSWSQQMIMYEKIKLHAHRSLVLASWLSEIIYGNATDLYKHR